MLAPQRLILSLVAVAQGAIVNADISAQLFKTINLMLSPDMAVALSVVVVTLLLTFLDNLCRFRYFDYQYIGLWW